MSEHGGGGSRRDTGGDNALNENGYVHRLMRIRCSHGSIDNYINIPTDHGVLAGEDQQPLLNANDHIAGKNVIHFGNCDSDENPERVFRKALVGGLLGGGLLGGLASDLLEKTGIMSFKCTPKTDEVWEETNDRNILDGAPALLMKSCLTCRYGGNITLVPLEEYPEEDESKETEEDAQKKEEKDIVKEETDAVLAAAMERIASTGDTGEQAVMEAQMYMAAAACADTAAAAAGICGSMAGSGITNSLNWMQAILCPAQQIAENFVHNQSIPFAGPFLDSSGMIINQGAMSAFQINNFTVAQAGGGAVAAYNACRLLQGAASPSFADIVHEMEPYGILNNTYGMMPCGIASYFVREGYQVEFEASDIAETMKNAGAGVLMYAASGLVGYVTCGKTNEEAPAFYNLPEGMDHSIRTFEELETGILAKGAFALLGMAISKKDNTDLEEQDEFYRRSHTAGKKADGKE